jgi:hypothetical protein
MAAESSAAGSMRKAPSMEWRWVSAGEEEEGEAGGPAPVGAVGRGGSFESEDEDENDEGDDEEQEEEARQKLIRTGPSVDWFDVEGNEVSVAQPLEDYEVSPLLLPSCSLRAIYARTDVLRFTRCACF